MPSYLTDPRVRAALFYAKKRRLARLKASTATPVFQTRVRIDIGQSNRMGLKAADQTQTQPYNNEMYASGVGSWITDAQARTQDRSSAIPLIEYDNYETGTAYGLNRMIELYEIDEDTTYDLLNHNYFGTNSAVSGQTIDQLSVGANIARTYADIDGIFPLFGSTASVDWITLIQGFSDASSTVAEYESDLSAYRDLVLDRIALTYPSAAPKMMICQHSIQRFGAGSDIPSPSLGQLNLATSEADVMIACPLYQSLWRDSGKHMSWQGQHLMEAYLTQAIFEVEKGTWLGPVEMALVRWTDTSIEISLSGGTGTYVLDTTHVGAADNSGFDVYGSDDTTREDIISGVVLSGNIITISLSSPASAGSQIAYGWGRSTTPVPNSTTIALGNVRDDGRGVSVTINATDYDLDNYALITTMPKP